VRGKGQHGGCVCSGHGGSGGVGGGRWAVVVALVWVLVIKSSAVEAGVVILVGAGGLVLGGMFLVVDVGPRCRGGVMRDVVGFVICCIGETGSWLQAGVGGFD